MPMPLDHISAKRRAVRVALTAGLVAALSAAGPGLATADPTAAPAPGTSATTPGPRHTRRGRPQGRDHHHVLRAERVDPGEEPVPAVVRDRRGRLREGQPDQ